jgi:hypothetical protein
MNYLAFPRASRNHISTHTEALNPIELPAVPSTAAGAHLHRRYHVPAGIADLLALLAGLGIEEARR